MKTPAGKSRGRKPAGSKSGSGAGKKRGMGVAQLEQYLRCEEMKKRLTTQRPAELVGDPVDCNSHHQLLSQTSTAAAVATASSGSNSCGLWGWDTGFVLHRLGNYNNGGFYGTRSSGLSEQSWVGGGPAYSQGGLELSSMPKFTQSLPPTDHCESCIKKRFTSLMSRNYCNEAFSSSMDDFSFPSAHNRSNLGGTTVELLGSSSVLQLGSEKKKEFEFFPGKNGRSTGSKVLGFSSSELELGIGTSYSAAADADDSNLVDLSLKLSY